MKRIGKAAVLGSGVMGSGIACHLAGAGIEVLLLDIVPFDLKEDEKANKKARNRMADTALANAIKSKPAPLYDAKFASRITTGNFDDDLAKISGVDWIIEVVVERLDIKQSLFEKVEKYRKPGTYVTSNTSGIPIGMIAEGRSEEFKAHFCGTHFFNPPRYMRLFEVIPHAGTAKEVTDFWMTFGDVVLGKQTVLCKDTAAFIANRVGVYAMAKLFDINKKLGLTIEEVDELTSTPMGRPKTGLYRLGDLVGHDTTVNVIKGLKNNLPNDEQKSVFEISTSLQFLIDNKFLGNKSGQGFYKKTGEKDEKGRPVILALDENTLEYRPSIRPKMASLELAKQIEELPRRIKAMFKHEDKGGQLIRESLISLFAYVSHRIPEISDTLFSIDDALRAGFAWEIGPFQYWDIIGISEGTAAAEAAGYNVADWVKEMLAAGHTSFYKSENGVKLYYDIRSKSYQEVESLKGLILLENYRDQKPVYENPEAVLHDIGDGVLCLEFRSKMNTMGEGVLKGINDAIDIAEKGNWKGLVIGNDAVNFSVGANLMMAAMMSFQQEWDELNFAIKYFQDTVMRCRYSSIPVVAATRGYVFGGACELSMHCDAVVAASESYIGLVEVGVGIIPGGAGTKEFALRASDAFFEGDVQIPTLIERFKTIATANVGTSAHEAFKYGYLSEKKDRICLNTQRIITEAKKEVLALADNYVRPIERTDIQVLGKSGLSALYVAAHSLQLGGYASEHDIKIAKKIAYVLCGGDLSAPQKVSEQYLLQVEREAILSLFAEPKTLERIQFMLEKGKPLRN
jgi:3-hydroxyacyl-CoA dehydrogenase